MTHQTVKKELENNGIQVLTPDHEMYWDDTSIVFPYLDDYILLYTDMGEFTYFHMRKEWDEEFQSTVHWGTAETLEEMLEDLELI